MKIKCLHCYKEFEGSVEHDGLGWHSSCPECGRSFDVDVPEGDYLMAFSDDEICEESVVFPTDMKSTLIARWYGYKTFDEFLESWKSMFDDNEGQWYWVVYNGKCILSGACDSNDEDILIGHKMEKLISQMNGCEKDTLYRLLWREYVSSDVLSILEENNYNENKFTDDEKTGIIEVVTDRVVYSGNYDCNLPYWDNLRNLIEDVIAIFVKEKREHDEMIEEIWEQFEDIPVNPETECMEEAFLHFESGTHREEIWHWFDKNHSKGVHWLLYERKE